MKFKKLNGKILIYRAKNIYAKLIFFEIIQSACIQDVLQSQALSDASLTLIKIVLSSKKFSFVYKCLHFKEYFSIDSVFLHLTVKMLKKV